MNGYFAPATTRHDPQFFMMRGKVAAHEDRPERVQRFMTGAKAAGLTLVEAQPAPLHAIHRVHTERYVAFLDAAFLSWRDLPAAAAEVVGNVQPRDPAAQYPDHIVGRAGWHLGDLACPIGEATFAAARASAGCALAAAADVRAGAHAAYALSRPPGHHASAEVAGGHCYLNNAAIAAAELAEHGRRVAVLDIDVHHGNGTQAIFYRRSDVFFASVHADPAQFYPWYNGYESERGADGGLGTTLNLPLDLGAADDAWLGAIGRAMDAINAFGPDALVISVGFDVHIDDPLGGMKVTTNAIAAAASLLAQLGRPTVIVQEGGYMSDALAANCEAFLTPFQEAAV